jgi:RNA polymerase sigma-70 factor (ECF subfamily)
VSVTGRLWSERLAALRAGDQEAFRVIWRTYHPALLRYLPTLVGQAAEDVASETWLQVARDLGGFAGEEADFKAWLFTIARHRALDWLRAHRRRPTESLDQETAEALVDRLRTDEQAIESIATSQAVALIRTLPRLQAEVVLLRVVAGLDVPEVAAMVGLSPGAVRVTSHRGLRRLAQLLGTSGVTEGVVVALPQP